MFPTSNIYLSGTGLTGPNFLGYGATGASVPTTVNHYTQEIPRAGFLLPIHESKNILARFYQKIQTILEQEETYCSKTNNFFSIQNQIEKDPQEYLLPNELYMYGLSIFYGNNQKISESNELWIRNGSHIYQIKLEKNNETSSGSIYQNPFSPENGMLFLGTVQDITSKRYCFCVENEKSIILIDDYYFNRSSCIHDIRESLIHENVSISQSHSNDNSVLSTSTSIISSILSGELSDDKIECTDGVVNVCKAILAKNSEYFFVLFTNSKYKKQKNYQLDFSKIILQYYQQYCFDIPYDLDITLINEVIEFGDFIQDKMFLAELYSKIFKLREHIENKSLIDIINIYIRFGFEIIN